MNPEIFYEMYELMIEDPRKLRSISDTSFVRNSALIMSAAGAALSFLQMRLLFRLPDAYYYVKLQLIRQLLSLSVFYAFSLFSM